jgi:amidohydrolase
MARHPERSEGFLPMLDEIKNQLPQTLAAATALRHELHQSPELTWQEEQTAEKIHAELKKIPGLKITTGVGRLGIMADLEGDGAGPTIALRADMDALPIQESSGVAYASQNNGKMHACGHDGHMAGVWGAAQLLSTNRAKLTGRVRFIFQPAEEGGAGALAMCNDGVLTDVDYIFGLHGWPSLPVGKVGVRYGAILATTTDFNMKIRGVGCHAAMPHLGTDQIVATAQVINALQTLSSRFVAPTEAVAVTVGYIRGGVANNVIPAQVECGGTLRALNRETLQELREKLCSVAVQAAGAHGASVDISFKEGYPATINDRQATDYVVKVANEIFGPGAAGELPAPSMGGEDFAYYLERIPGCFFFVGVDDGRVGGYPSLHHPGFDFNDRALATTIPLLVSLALNAKNLPKPQKPTLQ